MKVSRLPRLMPCAGLTALLLLRGGAVPAGATEPLRPAPARDDSAAVAAPDSSRTVHAMDEARLPRTKAAGGRKAGMIAGGVVGAGVGVLAGLLVNALVEGEDSGVRGTGWIPFVGGFTLAGVGAGALLGTLFGSMVEAEPVPAGPSLPGGGTQSEAQPDSAAAAASLPPRGPIGSVTLEGIAGGFPDRTGSHPGVGGLIALQAHRGARVRIGLEHGRLYSHPRLYESALALRVAVRPGLFAVAALANDHWSTGLNLLGGSVGLSLETGRPEARSIWVAEARYHFNLQNYDEPGGSLGLVTLGVGRRFGW